MALEVDKFKQILRDNNISITLARQEIFSTLLKSNRPLTKTEIALGTAKVHRASVYRSLELFERLGITATLVRGWKPFIELAEPFKPHHHHLQCTRCGQVTRLDNSELEQLVGRLAAARGYKMISHHIELNGLCAQCQVGS